MIENPALFWEYVGSHINDDPQSLRLAAYGKKYDFDIALAIMQIEARQHFGRKLAVTLGSCHHFLFPSLLSGEQSTSDILAQYHATLTGHVRSSVDLTAGLGIDAIHLSRNAVSVTAVERTPILAQVLRHNINSMGLSNIDVLCEDCRDMIDLWTTLKRYFDVVFIDPARRATDGSRIYSLEQSEPDVTSLLMQLRKICGRLIIKASPMLDVDAAVNSFRYVPSNVKAVGTPTECKELIFVFDFTKTADSSQLEALTLHGGGVNTAFTFKKEEESSLKMSAGSSEIVAGDTVYRPYPSVMKLGPYKLIAAQFGLCCFDANTKLFYSKHNDIKGFPGLRYNVMKVLPYNSKIIKNFAHDYPAAEVTALNFGITADQVRAKLKVHDGKNAVHIFAVTDAGKHRLLIVTRKC